jgi:hypothetical protein
MYKETLTVLLRGNMIGEMEKQQNQHVSRTRKLIIYQWSGETIKSLDDCSYNGRVVKHV